MKFVSGYFVNVSFGKKYIPLFDGIERLFLISKSVSFETFKKTAVLFVCLKNKLLLESYKLK